MCEDLVTFNCWARGGKARRAEATQSSGPLPLFFLCFRVQIFESLEISAACRAHANAQKTMQNCGKMPIFEELANQRHIHSASFCRFFKNQCFSRVLRHFLRTCTCLANSLRFVHIKFLSLETEGKGCPRAEIGTSSGAQQRWEVCRRAPDQGQSMPCHLPTHT